MKFSVIFGVAALISSAFAAPQPAAAEANAVSVVNKRVDITDIISELQTDITQAINQAKALTAKVQVSGPLGDHTVIANLTADMLSLNITVNDIVSLFGQIKLGGPLAPVATTVGGIVSGIIGTVEGAANTVGDLLDSIFGRDAGAASGAPVKRVDITDITSALGSLSNVGSLTGLVGELLAALGELLQNVIAAAGTIDGGSTNSTSGVGSVAGGVEDVVGKLITGIAGLIDSILSAL
ncbi:MAG: hypothetical protein STHCBS139747_006436 [Sporothrix thermara]